MQRVLRELSDAVGFGAAIEIARRWGGRELRVPVKVGPGDPLALALGLETARKLVAVFGAQILQLPVERNALLDLRNAAIVRMASDGTSQEKIGLEFGLTRQAVAHVLRTARDRAPQTLAVSGCNEPR